MTPASQVRIFVSIHCQEGHHAQSKELGSAISSSQSIGIIFFYGFSRNNYPAVKSIESTCTPKISCQVADESAPVSHLDLDKDLLRPMQLSLSQEIFSFQRVSRHVVLIGT